MATRACNRKDLCKGCACVKLGLACSGCRLGECHNQPGSTRKLSETRPRVIDDSCPPLSSPSSLDVDSFLSVPSPTTSRSSLSLDTSHVAPEVPLLPLSFLSVPSPTTSRSSLSLDTSHVAPEVPLLPTFPTLAPPSFRW